MANKNYVWLVEVRHRYSAGLFEPKFDCGSFPTRKEADFFIKFLKATVTNQKYHEVKFRPRKCVPGVK